MRKRKIAAPPSGDFPLRTGRLPGAGARTSADRLPRPCCSLPVSRSIARSTPTVREIPTEVKSSFYGPKQTISRNGARRARGRRPARRSGEGAVELAGAGGGLGGKGDEQAGGGDGGGAVGKVQAGPGS